MSALRLQADPNYDYQDIFPAMVSALSGDDGKLYAAPFYGESSMVFYRKDLFQAAGLTMPDKPTWDDIQGFAQKLHKPDPASTASACVLSPAGASRARR